jgi:signal recognition particle subunit SRP54
VEIARQGIEHAKRIGRDTVILDTAGRLTIDDALMDEIRAVAEVSKPTETLLVVDAMTGRRPSPSPRASPVPSRSPASS